MSVKKMGSRLAQGVRDIKAQQAQEAVATPAVAAPKRVTRPETTKPAAAPKAAKPDVPPFVHPDRVWPD
ncbi:hypothetical protein TPL01_33580 [Sulfuriferula plumbiphila]|uniref:Uncharacterized protein n=1 Tax=Sulfuriferula plumbiphila TaxID=171865 RepID=A0A512LCK2_9PROT|nr:hypothetical protein [Sulfuriferula plumbiphila]BBP05920.1 hypothetical protein SFPGR_33420 [Sulfuriferula plumbiphila]GEP32220.1 hypothetical protein TPL01_33580 [Sulfuriferula plumbiphila]